MALGGDGNGGQGGDGGNGMSPGWRVTLIATTGAVIGALVLAVGGFFILKLVVDSDNGGALDLNLKLGDQNLEIAYDPGNASFQDILEQAFDQALASESDEMSQLLGAIELALRRIPEGDPRGAAFRDGLLGASYYPFGRRFHSYRDITDPSSIQDIVDMDPDHEHYDDIRDLLRDAADRGRGLFRVEGLAVRIAYDPALERGQARVCEHSNLMRQWLFVTDLARQRLVHVEAFEAIETPSVARRCRRQDQAVTWIEISDEDAAFLTNRVGEALYNGEDAVLHPSLAME